MPENLERRSRQCESMIRRRGWELEAIESDCRRAEAALAQAQSAVDAIAAAMARTEASLRRALCGERLDPAWLQDARGYLAEQQDRHRQLSAQYRRAAQRAQEMNRRGNEVALAIKALERVKKSADRELKRDKEKRRAQRNLELFLSIRGEKLWKCPE